MPKELQVINKSTVLYCLEDAASYVGVSVLDFKSLLQQRQIRYCQKLSTPISDAFVLLDSVESHLNKHFLKAVADDTVKDGDTLPDAPRMFVTDSDVLQADILGYLGYLSFQAVHDLGHEIENTWGESGTYTARVFESFSGVRFSVYEVDQETETTYSIQSDKPLAFTFHLGKDGLLCDAFFSVEELERVKSNLPDTQTGLSKTPMPSAEAHSSTVKRQWKTPAEFFADEDNFTWRPDDGREAWWQVELQGDATLNKKCFYRALLLYFLYLPDAPDPSLEALLAFMRAYKPVPADDDPLWNLKELRGKKSFSLDGSENYQPHGNMKRAMVNILQTRKRPMK